MAKFAIFVAFLCAVLPASVHCDVPDDTVARQQDLYPLATVDNIIAESADDSVVGENSVADSIDSELATLDATFCDPSTFFVAKLPIVDTQSKVDLTALAAEPSHNDELIVGGRPMRLTLARFQPTWSLSGYDGIHLSLLVKLNRDAEDTIEHPIGSVTDFNALGASRLTMSKANQHGWMAYYAYTKHDTLESYTMSTAQAAKTFKGQHVCQVTGSWVIYNLVYRIPDKFVDAFSVQFKILPFAKYGVDMPEGVVVSPNFKFDMGTESEVIAIKHLAVSQPVAGSSTFQKPVQPGYAIDFRWRTDEPILDLQHTSTSWTDRHSFLRIVFRTFERFVITHRDYIGFNLYLVDDKGNQTVVGRLDPKEAFDVVPSALKVSDRSGAEHITPPEVNKALAETRHITRLAKAKHFNVGEEHLPLVTRYFVAKERTWLKERGFVPRDEKFGYTNMAGDINTFAVFVSLPNKGTDNLPNGRYRLKYERFTPKTDRNGIVTQKILSLGYMSAIEVQFGAKGEESIENSGYISDASSVVSTGRRNTFDKHDDSQTPRVPDVFLSDKQKLIKDFNDEIDAKIKAYLAKMFADSRAEM